MLSASVSSEIWNIYDIQQLYVWSWVWWYISYETIYFFHALYSLSFSLFPLYINKFYIIFVKYLFILELLLHTSNCVSILTLRDFLCSCRVSRSTTRPTSLIVREATASARTWTISRRAIPSSPSICAARPGRSVAPYYAIVVIDAAVLVVAATTDSNSSNPVSNIKWTRTRVARRAVAAPQVARALSARTAAADRIWRRRPRYRNTVYATR